MRSERLLPLITILHLAMAASEPPIIISPNIKSYVISDKDSLLIKINEHVKVKKEIMSTAIFYKLKDPEQKGVSLSMLMPSTASYLIHELELFDSCYLSDSSALNNIFLVCRKPDNSHHFVHFQLIFLPGADISNAQIFRFESIKIESSDAGEMECYKIRCYGNYIYVLCGAKMKSLANGKNFWTLIFKYTLFNQESQTWEISARLLESLEFRATEEGKWDFAVGDYEAVFQVFVFKTTYTHLNRSGQNQMIFLHQTKANGKKEVFILSLNLLISNLISQMKLIQLRYLQPTYDFVSKRYFLSITLVNFEETEVLRGIELDEYVVSYLIFKSTFQVIKSMKYLSTVLITDDPKIENFANVYVNSLSGYYMLVTKHRSIRMNLFCNREVFFNLIMCKQAKEVIEIGTDSRIEILYYKIIDDKNPLGLSHIVANRNQMSEYDNENLEIIYQTYFNGQSSAFKIIKSGSIDPKIPYKTTHIWMDQYSTRVIDSYQQAPINYRFDLSDSDFIDISTSYPNFDMLIKLKGSKLTLSTLQPNIILKIDGNQFEGKEDPIVLVTNGKNILLEIPIHTKKILRFEEASEFHIPRFEVNSYPGEWAELPFSKNTIIAQDPKIEVASDLDSRVIYSNKFVAKIKGITILDKFDTIRPIGDNYYIAQMKDTLENMQSNGVAYLIVCERSSSQFVLESNGPQSIQCSSTLNIMKPSGFYIVDVVIVDIALVVFFSNPVTGGLSQLYLRLDQKTTAFKSGPNIPNGDSYRYIRRINPNRSANTIEIIFAGGAIRYTYIATILIGPVTLQQPINNQFNVYMGVIGLMSFLSCASDVQKIEGDNDDLMFTVNNNLCGQYNGMNEWHRVVQSNPFNNGVFHHKTNPGSTIRSYFLRLKFDANGMTSCSAYAGVLFWSPSNSYILAYDFPDDLLDVDIDPNTNRYKFNLEQHGITKLLKMNCISTKSIVQFFAIRDNGKKVIVNLNLATLEHSGKRVHSIVEVDDDVQDIESLNIRGGDFFETVLIKSHIQMLNSGVEIYRFDIKGPHVFIKTPEVPKNMSIQINIETGKKKIMSDMNIRVENLLKNPLVTHLDKIDLTDSKKNYILTDLFTIKGPITKLLLEPTSNSSSLSFTSRNTLLETSGFFDASYKIDTIDSVKDWVLGIRKDKTRVFIFKSNSKNKENLKQRLSYPDFQHDIDADRSVKIVHASFVRNTPKDTLIAALIYSSSTNPLQIAFLINRNDNFEIEKSDVFHQDFENIEFTMVHKKLIHVVYTTKDSSIFTTGLTRASEPAQDKKEWLIEATRFLLKATGNIRSVSTTSHSVYKETNSNPLQQEMIKAELHVYIAIEGEEDLRVYLYEISPNSASTMGKLDPFHPPISGMPVLVKCESTDTYGNDLCLIDSNGSFFVILKCSTLNPNRRDSIEGILFDSVTVAVLQKPTHVSIIQMSMNHKYAVALMTQTDKNFTTESEKRRLISIYNIEEKNPYQWIVMNDLDHKGLIGCRSVGLTDHSLLYIPTEGKEDPMEGHILREATFMPNTKGFEWGAQKIKFIGLSDQNPTLPLLQYWDKGATNSKTPEETSIIAGVSIGVMIGISIGVIGLIVLCSIGVYYIISKLKICCFKKLPDQYDTGIDLI